MTAVRLEIEMGFPLRWPEGRPRTLAPDRKRALFKHDGRDITLDAARARLRTQLEIFTRNGQSWRTADIVLSLNIRFTLSGGRDQNFRREPEDCGVALYFSLDGRPYVLACDRWASVAENIAAIAAHIDALRGQERWGVADLRQAFAGHTALPAPGQSATENWWQVLGVRRDAPIVVIENAWRALAPAAHPDRNGGSHEAMARLNVARDQGRKENHGL